MNFTTNIQLATMINKISIKDIATFDNSGIEINDLKEINVIYGANGTGKSTISRILANTAKYQQSEVVWVNGIPIDILVYNKEFCEKNYMEQMPGVFTLGEATSDALTEINAKKVKLEEIKSLVAGYKNNITTQTDTKNSEISSFRESAWNDLLKKYESHFPKSSISAGTKDSFVSKLIKAHDDRRESPLLFDDLRQKAETLFGSQPNTYDLISLCNYEDIQTLESNPIWQKVIVGKQDIDIADLIMRLGSSDWVSQGLLYLSEGDDVCPFCQQHTITQDFKEKINNFFDDSYKNDIHTIEQLTENYIVLTSSVVQTNEEILRIHKSTEKHFVDTTALESVINSLKVAIAGNIELLNSKKKEPSHKITLTATIDILDAINEIIRKANEAITENNRIASNFTDERTQLISEIWNFFANSYSATIDAHIKKINGIDKAIQNFNEKIEEAKKQYGVIKSELIELENSVTSVTPTVNEINRLLKGYGFTNFLIQEVPERKNYYRIE